MRRSTAVAGIIVEKNVGVPMSDEVTLRVNVFRSDQVTPGTRSRPERPRHAHRTVEPIDPGELTQMTVEIWSSSTHFASTLASQSGTDK
jgi:hypothetical protein